MNYFINGSRQTLLKLYFWQSKKTTCMKKILLLVLLASSLAGMAQKKARPQTFANEITAADLQHHLYIIAGPGMEGRETATEGQKKAAAYIENEFRSLGLLPGNNGSYQMKYPVFRDSLVQAGLEVNGHSFTYEQDFAVNLASSYSAGLMAGEVVFVGAGISDSTRDDYAGVNCTGKVVLVLPGGNNTNGNRAGGPRRRYNPYLLQEAAASHGAIAILQVQPNFPRKDGSRLGNMYLSGYKKTNYPNTFYISPAVAKAIMGNDYEQAAEASKAGNPTAKAYSTELSLQLEKMTQHLESSNVLGVLEGTDLKDEYVFITAHYDHLGKRDNGVIYYGADDDGSGTTSVLELAKAFSRAKAAGHGPRRTIVFMTVSGEEKGLWGSSWYSEHPVFPLDSTTVDLNIDMIGRIDPKRSYGDSTNYVYVVGDDKLSSDLRPISEANNKKYVKLELDYKYNDPNDPERIYYRSDHFNFARKGVPIIFYFNGTHADYHRPTDTPDKINYDLMAKRARLVFFTAWDMANRNDMLKRDIPLNMPGR